MKDSYSTFPIASLLPPGPQTLPEECLWVPCIPNPVTGAFIPLYDLSTYPAASSKPVRFRKPPSPISRGGLKLHPWTVLEDKLLTDLVKEFGLKQWVRIAKLLNEDVHAGSEVRKGKHCRERWLNHVNPELNSIV